MMDFHKEPSSVRGSTVTDLKEPSPGTGFRLRGPFFDSLFRILSLSEDGSGSGLNSQSSPTCGFNSSWSPIDFQTSSVRCPRALNLLSGRSFSAISGTSLDPPPCLVHTPGCICRKGPSSSLDADRSLSTGHPSSGFSPISTTCSLEVGIVVPSPNHGMQDVANETAVHSGPVDDEVDVECSDFEARSLKLPPVASVDEDVATEMEKSHTEEVYTNQLVPIEGLDDLTHAVRHEDLGLPFDGTQRKQEEQEDGRLVSCDANPSSSITEEFGRVVFDELPTDSTIPLQITDLEEGEIQADEMQIPVNDSLDLLPKEACTLSETKFCNSTSSYQGPITAPILKDLNYSNISPGVLENLASTGFPVNASFGDDISDVPGGNAGRWGSFKTKAILQTDKIGVIGELEREKGNNHGGGSGTENPELNVLVPKEKISVGDLAQVYKTVLDGKDVELHKGKKNWGPIADEAKAQRQVYEILSHGYQRIQDVELHKGKKKRGPITDKAKAQKKRRKKQKRAEMDKKLGVKKLRLPISMPKPKPVSLCRYYYSKGQCRQGKDCQFSHDAVPLTKSQPCVFLANRNSPCLKGDECPFDHDLSKYPCHKFVLNGSCIRGDKCLFSHKKVPPNGDASVNTKETCIELEKHAEKSVIRKSMNVIGNKKMPSQGLMSEKQSEKPSMLPSRVPEGISFLSFDNPTVGAANKLQVRTVPSPNTEDKTPVRKQNQNTEQSSVEAPFVFQGRACPPLLSIKSTQQEYKSAPSSTCRAISNALAFASKYQSELRKTPTATPASCLQSSTPNNDSHIGPNLAINANGSSDRSKTATMILEEFLFGGAKT